jgi:hypothetical protein
MEKIHLTYHISVVYSGLASIYFIRGLLDLNKSYGVRACPLYMMLLWVYHELSFMVTIAFLMMKQICRASEPKNNSSGVSRGALVRASVDHKKGVSASYERAGL